MDKYTLLRRHGEGSYAVVWKAKRKQDSKLVAIKQLKQSVSTWEECKSLSEVQFLAQMRSHDNVIKLLELVRIQSQVFLVFEYCESNLYQTMQVMLREGKGFAEDQIRWTMAHILKGLQYIHSKGFIHRDIKPENVLLSGSRAAKLCDFGQSKAVDAKGPFTPYVATRWYRAPELLLQSRSYNSGVDLWAAGVLMAELFNLRPVFAGSSAVDQLFKIATVVGNPEDNGWAEGVKLAATCGYSFPAVKRIGFRSILPHAPPAAVDLIEGLVCMNPARRLTATQALAHPFLSGAMTVVLPLVPETRDSDEATAKSAAAEFARVLEDLASGERKTADSTSSSDSTGRSGGSGGGMYSVASPAPSTNVTMPPVSVPSPVTTPMYSESLVKAGAAAAGMPLTRRSMTNDAPPLHPTPARNVRTTPTDARPEFSLESRRGRSESPMRTAGRSMLGFGSPPPPLHTAVPLASANADSPPSDSGGYSPDNSRYDPAKSTVDAMAQPIIGGFGSAAKRGPASARTPVATGGGGPVTRFPAAKTVSPTHDMAARLIALGGSFEDIHDNDDDVTASLATATAGRRK